AVPAQRLGQLVPGLPRRASRADPFRRDQAGARGRLQLEGRARRRDALARAVRQSLLDGAGGLRGPLRDRLGHLRRARDLPGGQGRDRALEARRPAGRRADPARAAACARRARGFVMRWLLALYLALAPCLAFAQAAQDPAPLQFDDRAEERRFHQLTSELRCVMCQNQSLADSNAQIAHDLRREVLALMREGRSDEQIKQFLVARYGEFVLYRPRVEKTTWLLWFGPALLLLLGALVVWRVVRRHAGNAPVAADDEQEW